MDWDTTEDKMNAFLGAFLILLGLIFIPEIRKSLKRTIFVIISVIILSWLGCRKVKRDANAVADNKKATDSLSREIRRVINFNINLAAQKSSDSVKNQEFQTRLFNEFKITRDSVTNKPIQKNITTNVGKARDIYIQ